MLGGGFRAVQLGGQQFVQSVPEELDRDANVVLEAAQVRLWNCSSAKIMRAVRSAAGCRVTRAMLDQSTAFCPFCRSICMACSTDGPRALELTQERGHASAAELEQKLRWPDTRVQAALQKLLAQGLGMIDDPPGGTARLYWFPCLDRPAGGGASAAS